MGVKKRTIFTVRQLFDMKGAWMGGEENMKPSIKEWYDTADGVTFCQAMWGHEEEPRREEEKPADAQEYVKVIKPEDLDVEVTYSISGPLVHFRVCLKMLGISVNSAGPTGDLDHIELPEHNIEQAVISEVVDDKMVHNLVREMADKFAEQGWPFEVAPGVCDLKVKRCSFHA